MGMETTFGWMILIILGMAVLFYSIGYSTGRKDGYLRGRSAGMRIGADRRVNHG